VSLTRHDRYTPELRDKLYELGDAVCPRAPILSLYFRLTPERMVGGARRSYLSSLSDTALNPVHDRKVRQALEQEIAQVSQALEDELPVPRFGTAFSSCRTAGLWRQIALP
jgi:hypothetical protein